MTDASLPDRVEAVARALAEDFGPLPWNNAPAEDKHWRYLQAERVLAAADACEAERNPNTRAVVLAALVERYRGEQPPWTNVEDEDWTPTVKFVAEDGGTSLRLARLGEIADLVVAAIRRPVSSEDVHRADFSAESVRNSDLQSPNEYGTEQK